MGRSAKSAKSDAPTSGSHQEAFAVSASAQRAAGTKRKSRESADLPCSPSTNRSGSSAPHAGPKSDKRAKGSDKTEAKSSHKSFMHDLFAKAAPAKAGPQSTSGADPKAHAQAKAAATSKAKAKARPTGCKDDLFGEEAKARAKTEEGWNVYTEAELQLGSGGGGTDLCPFDCDCCF